MATIAFPHRHEFRCSNDPWFSRLDKQTARAQITAAPRDRYESSVPSRRAKILQGRHLLDFPIRNATANVVIAHIAFLAERIQTANELRLLGERR